MTTSRSQRRMFSLFESPHKKLERVCRETGNDSILASLLTAKKGNFDLTTLEFVDGFTPLHLCAINGFAPCIKLLLSNGAANNSQLKTDGSTPCMLASYAGHVDAVTALLDGGASLSVTCNRGYTALHYAASGGKTSVCSLLIDRGSDIAAVSLLGYSALLMAACSGRTETVAFFLSSTAASISETENKGNTCLHMACAGGYVTLVDFLMQAGANHEARNKKGKTPQDLCRTDNRKDVNVIIASNVAARELLEAEQRTEQEQYALSIRDNAYTVYPSAYSVAAGAAGLAFAPLVGGYKMISESLPANSKLAAHDRSFESDSSSSGYGGFDSDSGADSGVDINGFASMSESESGDGDTFRRNWKVTKKGPASHQLDAAGGTMVGAAGGAMSGALAVVPPPTVQPVTGKWGLGSFLSGQRKPPTNGTSSIPPTTTPQPSSQVQPFLTPTSPAAIQRMVTILYTVVNPSKLPLLPQIFDEWAQREDLLLSQVLVQYAPAVSADPIAASVQEYNIALDRWRANPEDAGSLEGARVAFAKSEDLFAQKTAKPTVSIPAMALAIPTPLSLSLPQSQSQSQAGSLSQQLPVPPALQPQKTKQRRSMKKLPPQPPAPAGVPISLPSGAAIPLPTGPTAAPPATTALSNGVDNSATAIDGPTLTKKKLVRRKPPQRQVESIGDIDV